VMAPNPFVRNMMSMMYLSDVNQRRRPPYGMTGVTQR